MKSSFEAQPLMARHEFVPRVAESAGQATDASASQELEAEAQAHAAGRAEGRAEAEATLREPLSRAVRALDEALEALRSVHADESGALADAIVELALAVAGRLVSTELRENAESMVPLIAEALDALGNDEAVEIALASEDADRVREGALPELDRLRESWRAEIVGDPALRPGEAIVRGGAASVDLRVAAMLERFRTALREAGPAAGASS